MDWKDNKKTKIIYFSDLEAGDVFLCSDNIINIKINSEEAFDVCNNETAFFRQDEEVTKRNATLVLD